MKIVMVALYPKTQAYSIHLLVIVLELIMITLMLSTEIRKCSRHKLYVTASVSSEGEGKRD